MNFMVVWQIEVMMAIGTKTFTIVSASVERALACAKAMQPGAGIYRVSRLAEVDRVLTGNESEEAT
jgi:hypothetical protein